MTTLPFKHVPPFPMRRDYSLEWSKTFRCRVHGSARLRKCTDGKYDGLRGWLVGWKIYATVVMGSSVSLASVRDSYLSSEETYSAFFGIYLLIYPHKPRSTATKIKKCLSNFGVDILTISTSWFRKYRCLPLRSRRLIQEITLNLQSECP